MALLVKGMSGAHAIATSSLFMLHWVCLEQDVCLCCQAKHLEALLQMKGMNLVSNLLCPHLALEADDLLVNAVGASQTGAHTHLILAKRCVTLYIRHSP